MQKIMTVACCLAVTVPLTVSAGKMEDTRTMVKLPSDIEKKMLVNMRDHIGALDDIIQAVQAGEYDEAQEVAESRLGWSSLVRRGDQEVANHWAKPMQKMADQMYRSASDFVIVAQNASVEDSKESYQKVLSALGEITAACRGCHQTYRVR
jgi:hypothetical protein